MNDSLQVLNDELEVKHNLPRQVIYCQKCVMSNQRPATSSEFRKRTSKDTPTSAFNAEGICDACRFYELKKTFDWVDRERKLRELCDRFRRDDGRYDVIVPGSGGKDSIFVAHLLREKYGMHPLTVTWAPHAYTDIGWKNFQAWLKSGFHNVLFTPNPVVHGYLTRLAFLNLVNPFQPFIIGQKVLAPKIAEMYDVPFIMYGENQAEAGNNFSDNLSPLMDASHFTCTSESDPLYFGGVELKELIAEHKLSKADMRPYLPLTRERYEAAGMEVHFMSFYVNWSPQQNYYYAIEVSDFESNPLGRSEGTYTKYASLDDKIDGQHYYTMLMKFGQGRAMNDACRDIRDGYISREEGVALVNRFDLEFPKNHFRYFLDYIGIDEEKYWETVDNARSPHLWKKEGNDWVLRHPCR
jgi:N-acetyl sugar amidotransferase